MFPFPMFTLYVIAAYLMWWFISRLALLGAWMYSKPGTFTIKHWVFTFLSLCPVLMEVVSSVLVIFAVAFGIDPHNRRVDV